MFEAFLSCGSKPMKGSCLGAGFAAKFVEFTEHPLWM
jgi:hypothetical protein